MARGENLVVLIGNLVKDPELSSTTGDTARCSMRIAVPKPYSGKGKKDEAVFIPLIAWGKLAEVCGQHLGKGSKVYVKGWLSVRQYQGKQGTAWATEVVVTDIVFLGGAASNQDTQDGQVFSDSDEDSIPF